MVEKKCLRPNGNYGSKWQQWEKARGQALHHLYYQLGEAVKYNSMKEICLVVRGQVHDITHFLNEHPSGEEVLLEQTGAGEK